MSVSADFSLENPKAVLLLESVRTILAKWSVTKLAREMEMGGRDTEEKFEWMAHVISEYVAAVDLSYLELADYVEEILGNEFAIQLESDDIDLVCDHILAIKRELEQGLDEKVSAFVQANQKFLALPTSNIVRRKPASMSSDESEDGKDSGDESDDNTQKVPPVQQPALIPKTSAPARPRVDEDGWTFVPGKKK